MATAPVRSINTTDATVARRMGIVRVWDAMLRGARAYVEAEGFVAVHNMPHIVGITGACENIDTLFKTDFFGERAYLTQTGQLYLELITPHLRRVYTEIQSFRSEPTVDDRHLCQFSLFEIEHQGNLSELIGHIGGIVRNMARYVINDCPDVLALFGRDPEELGDLQFGCMTYEQAINYLKPEFPDLEFGDDLKAHHERLLASRLGPMFLTHFPLPIKFFNMRQNEQDPRVVNSTDLILPLAGESAGAAEREHHYDRIVERLKSSPMYRRLIELGGTDDDFAWYLDAHKGKDIPLHSGAGVGVARVAQFILGVPDIRDAVPFVINRENLL
ncbi:MAG: hypothetical protein FJZ01_06905 [Candidatus Sericytochromatia bacterium]|nr:hypothetical protein [Candidatus Tanganyikabacteria bacterium]